jgi:Sec-independent protein secretion pathway component TatC
MKLNAEQIRALAAGAMVMLVQGSLYVFGAISPYLISFLYYEGNLLIIQEIQQFVKVICRLF